MNQPSLNGFDFSREDYDRLHVGANASVNFPDIGDLNTALSADGDTILGYSFGFQGIMPVIPGLHAFIQEPRFRDARYIVRRTATRRVSVGSVEAFLRIEFCWLHSGVLTVTTCYHAIRDYADCTCARCALREQNNINTGSQTDHTLNYHHNHQSNYARATATSTAEAPEETSRYNTAQENDSTRIQTAQDQTHHPSKCQSTDQKQYQYQYQYQQQQQARQHGLHRSAASTHERVTANNRKEAVRRLTRRRKVMGPVLDQGEIRIFLPKEAKRLLRLARTGGVGAEVGAGTEIGVKRGLLNPDWYLRYNIREPEYYGNPTFLRHCYENAGRCNAIRELLTRARCKMHLSFEHYLGRALALSEPQSTVTNPSPMRTWSRYQSMTSEARQHGTFRTTLIGKTGTLNTVEAAYRFLVTHHGISVHGRIQHLLTQLGIHYSKPELDRILLTFPSQDCLTPPADQVPQQQVVLQQHQYTPRHYQHVQFQEPVQYQQAQSYQHPQLYPQQHQHQQPEQYIPQSQKSPQNGVLESPVTPSQTTSPQNYTGLQYIVQDNDGTTNQRDKDNESEICGENELELELELEHNHNHNHNHSHEQKQEHEDKYEHENRVHTGDEEQEHSIVKPPVNIAQIHLAQYGDQQDEPVVSLTVPSSVPVVSVSVPSAVPPTVDHHLPGMNTAISTFVEQQLHRRDQEPSPLPLPCISIPGRSTGGKISKRRRAPGYYHGSNVNLSLYMNMSVNLSMRNIMSDQHQTSVQLESQSTQQKPVATRFTSSVRETQPHDVASTTGEPARQFEMVGARDGGLERTESKAGTTNETATATATATSTATGISGSSDREEGGGGDKGGGEEERELEMFLDGRRVEGEASEKEAWECGKCGMVIKGKRGNLKRHILIKHYNVRQFECSVPGCGRRFQNRVNLKRHEAAVHHGRPFQCPLCPRAFKKQTDLDGHVCNAHSDRNRQPLACEFCGRCFDLRGTLNRHRRTVHVRYGSDGTDRDGQEK